MCHVRAITNLFKFFVKFSLFINVCYIFSIRKYKLYVNFAIFLIEWNYPSNPPYVSQLTCGKYQLHRWITNGNHTIAEVCNTGAQIGFACLPVIYRFLADPHNCKKQRESTYPFSWHSSFSIMGPTVEPDSLLPLPLSP